MAVDTKPNLSNDKFEQLSTDTLNLSGTTIIKGNIKIASGGTFQLLSSPSAGKILTSDASGFASWQTLSIPSVPITGATNGLTAYSKNIGLGGILTRNTGISGAYTLSFSGGSKINSYSGYQVSGITVFRTAPNSISTILIGQNAGCNGAAGTCNVGIGVDALKNTTTGYRNVAIGAYALSANTTQCFNTAIGSNALLANKGTENTAVGASVLCKNTTGSWNTAIGTNSLFNNISGCDNVAVGDNALYCNTTGIENIAMGYAPLRSNTIGSGNIAIGRAALRNNITGSTNIAIGTAAGYNNTGSCNVLIGRQAGFSETGNNKLHIANFSGCTLIYGDFIDKYVTLPTLKLSTTPNTGTCSDSVLVWNSSTCQINKVAYVSGSTAVVSSVPSLSKEIALTSHGFNVGDVLGFSGGTYNKAIADGTYDGEILGIVSWVKDNDNFDLTLAGYITGLTGLVISSTYFLSDASAGLLTTDEPTGDTHIVKAMLLADSDTSGYVLPYPAYVVGSGSTGGGTWGTIEGSISGQTDLWSYISGTTTMGVYTITGNSTNTGFTITHNKNQLFVGVEVMKNVSPYPTVFTEVNRPDANNVYIAFDSPPATGVQYKVLIYTR